MCCGSRRSAWRNASPPMPGPATRPPVHQAAPARADSSATPAGPTRGGFPTVMMRYQAPAPIRLRGPATGVAYAFSPAAPTQAVDMRDAAVFARNTAFQAVEV